jgi:glycosyltransferase involved in cell wall biosynthesis
MTGVKPLIVALFTESFPYDSAGELPFLATELKYLRSVFDRVILVPLNLHGEVCPAGDGIEVDESYGRCLGENNRRLQKIIHALSSRLFYRDLLRRPGILLSAKAMRDLLFYVSAAKLTHRWFVQFVEKHGIEPENLVCYTYWFNMVTLGLGLAKARDGHFSLVTRAHGADLYEELYPPGYIPCRLSSLELLDRVFADSSRGTDYLIRRYPRFSNRVATALVGMPDPGFITVPSSDGVFRIVSCSFMVPVKRLHLIVRGLARAAEKRPDSRFTWQHFGSGPLMEDISRLAKQVLPDNVTALFPGYVVNDALMLFYRNEPVDLFMNTSESEGTPLSIMEAMSCGIPVVATAVGGNPEIVNAESGLLLSPDPSSEEVAEVVLRLMDDRRMLRKLAEGARRTWQERYNAERNFMDFALELKSLIKNKV